MKTIDDLIKHGKDVEVEIPGINHKEFKIHESDTYMGTLSSMPTKDKLIFRAVDVQYETTSGTISIVELFNTIEDLKLQIGVLKTDVEVLRIEMDLLDVKKL